MKWRSPGKESAESASVTFSVFPNLPETVDFDLSEFQYEYVSLREFLFSPVKDTMDEISYSLFRNIGIDISEEIANQSWYDTVDYFWKDLSDWFFHHINFVASKMTDKKRTRYLDILNMQICIHVDDIWDHWAWIIDFSKRDNFALSHSFYNLVELADFLADEIIGLDENDARLSRPDSGPADHRRPSFGVFFKADLGGFRPPKNPLGNVSIFQLTYLKARKLGIEDLGFALQYEIVGNFQKFELSSKVAVDKI